MSGVQKQKINSKKKIHSNQKGTDDDSTERKERQSASKSDWLLVFGLVVLVTIGTRFYKLTEPDHVCWDETHFGKMGSWYINRTFFFDVHPPLGKMLIALSGYVTGYNGTYPFEKPGDKYNGTSYEGMRFFCTALGALIVPMAFDTVHDLTRSNEAALVSAAYLIFDVGLITLNQYILLDPLLLCFMMASVWGMVKVSKTTRCGASYTLRWWLWLLFTGTMLSCTSSVKFVGLFVVLLVGLHTATELWLILGDMRQSIWETIKQIVCRALTLIAWPILLYMVFFYIHLRVLNRSGNGDGFYSSAFQSRLIGNSLYNASMPRDVAYTAIVTIKNHKTGGGYLHSHYHLYPKGVGAKQQQITTYTHKDGNNKWLIKPYNMERADGVRLLQHGDLVRLQHIATGRNLHSHFEPAPMTKKHLQVTGYGESGIGDANDIWRVVVVNGRSNETVKTVTTRLKFVHLLQNCVLTASGKQLPKWGFEQQEVSCNQNLRDKNALWNVEDNQHLALPSVNFSVYAPGFLARFVESHAVMIQGNAGLKPKEGEVTSRPWQWPINYRGQYFSGSSHRVYLLGNPIIWWSNLIFLALFLIVFFITAVKERRQAGRRLQQQQQQLLQQQTEQHENHSGKHKSGIQTITTTTVATTTTTKTIACKTRNAAERVSADGMIVQHENGETLSESERELAPEMENDEVAAATQKHCDTTTPPDAGNSTNTNNNNNKKRDNSSSNKSANGNAENSKNDEQLAMAMTEAQTEALATATSCATTNTVTLKAAVWLFIGWMLHYVPFWAMGRVLYFHHYFPALIFNSMLTGVMFNFLTGHVPRWLQQALLGAMLSILVWSFVLFAPLAYGMSGPLANEPDSAMHGLKWLSSWEF